MKKIIKYYYIIYLKMKNRKPKQLKLKNSKLLKKETKTKL